MNVIEMEDNVTYLLCPDKTCKLFTKPNCHIPCEKECPHIDKLVKIVRCPCGDIVELPGNHSSLRRVDHQCQSGATGSTFARISGKYERIFAVVK